MKTIQLSNGAMVLVDDADFDTLSQFNWHQDSKGYAYRLKRIGKGKRLSFRMHRVILNVPSRVDHQDLNKLNNQRHNLRPCTQSQNNCNHLKRSNNTSGYKGVQWYKRDSKWMARIQFEGRVKCLGFFDDILEAANAYNAAAITLHGEFARINTAQIGAGQKVTRTL